jgi:diguanylate cyclase (GGDEF)-like protein/PAS domain S-box-containing protein
VLGAAVVVWCAVAVAWLLAGAGGLTTRSVVGSFTMVGVAVAAGVLCVDRGRAFAEPRLRQAWTLLGAGCLTWAVGLGITIAMALNGTTDPVAASWSDPVELSAAVLFGAALVRLATPAPSLTARLRLVMDGLLVSVAILLVSWVAVLRPMIEKGPDDTLTQMVTLAYPVSDAAIMTLAAFAVLRARTTAGRVGRPLLLVVVGLLVFALGDTGWAYLAIDGRYESGGRVDVGWVAAFAVLCCAALSSWTHGEKQAAPGEPAATAEQAAPGEAAETAEQAEAGELVEAVPIGMLLPYVVVVASVVIAALVARQADGDDDVRAWLRTLLIVFMVARQVLALQENRQLTRTLERRVADRTAELQLSRARFRSLVEHSSEVVSLVDRHGVLLYQSEPGERVFGRPADSLLGRPLADHLDAASQRTITAALARVSRTPMAVTMVELRFRHGDGGWRQIETTLTNLLDEPAVEALVLNSRDVSERRELEGQLLHQAFHDSLTGLANRALFNDRVAHALKRRRHGAERIGVLFLDLNGFKEVNDSLGHASGDALLVLVAQRLWTCVRRGDTVARLGGDEFAVLVEGDGEPADPFDLARRIREAMDEPFALVGREFFVSGSIGIATSGDGVNDAGELVRNADLAMYRAKAQRDLEFAVYDPSMRDLLMDKLELESDLRRAVRDGELHVHYQPTYTLDETRLVGVEALLRWRHPVRGDIPPMVFIPVAESSDLIHELGRFVLFESCRQAARWHDLAPDRSPSVAVNISGRQLQRAGFVDEVRRILEETALPPHLLTLELTESTLMNDTDGSMQALALLKHLGVRLAIDDFGTGYSSLSYLHRFPVDILKIDRSFVERLSGDDAEENLVHSIVRLGQTLQLQTVAEGIEDSDQLERLQRLGCELAQGYHFGRPDRPEVITDLLTHGTVPVPRAAPATEQAPTSTRGGS